MGFYDTLALEVRVSNSELYLNKNSRWTLRIFKDVLVQKLITLIDLACTTLITPTKFLLYTGHLPQVLLLLSTRFKDKILIWGSRARRRAAIA